MILKWTLSILKGCGVDEFGSGQCQVTDCCEHGDGPSASIKCGELDHRGNW